MYIVYNQTKVGLELFKEPLIPLCYCILQVCSFSFPIHEYKKNLEIGTHTHMVVTNRCRRLNPKFQFGKNSEKEFTDPSLFTQPMISNIR